MIGVLLLAAPARHAVPAPAGPLPVLGLATALRGVLALQAAGVERVFLCGPGALEFARDASRDDRVRIALEPCADDDDDDELPAGDVLLLAPAVVADARALKSLAAEAPDARVADATGALLAARLALPAARVEAALARAATARECACPGVLVAATDRASVRAATRALLDSLRKPQDGWVSRALNRRLSLAVTRWLVWTPIRPNPLSLAILGVGLYGAWLAAQGTRAALAVGGVLFQAQSVLDGCDGELSRLTFRGSRTGEWLDTIGDDLTNYGFFAGAALGLHGMGLGRAPLVVGALGVAVGVVASAIEYRYLIRMGSGDLLKYPLGFGSDPEPSTAPRTLLARVLGAIRPAFKRDFFVLLTMLAALAGPYPMLAMLALFAAGACATLAAVIASEVRRARYQR